MHLDENQQKRITAPDALIHFQSVDLKCSPPLNHQRFERILQKADIAMATQAKIIITSEGFKKYSYVHHDGTSILFARRNLSGFSIYLCDGDTFVGKLKSNVFGTRYAFDYRTSALGEKVANSKFEVFYESSFLEKDKPRSLGVILNGLELINKKPFFSPETNSYALEFNGRVTMPSVRNFQIIHPLEPTFITLTFGKESDKVYILDYSNPWCILMAFSVGLTALDYKIGCD